jgi:hypothetical protein
VVLGLLLAIFVQSLVLAKIFSPESLLAPARALRLDRGVAQCLASLLHAARPQR